MSPWSLKMGFLDRIAMMAAQLVCSAFKAQESSVLRYGDPGQRGCIRRPFLTG
jgi:hypothetical protein